MPPRQLLGISNAPPVPEAPPSPLGQGWALMGGPCRPVRHTRPVLPTHLPAPGPAEESGEDDSEDDDEDEGDYYYYYYKHL